MKLIYKGKLDPERVWLQKSQHHMTSAAPFRHYPIKWIGSFSIT